VTHSSYTTLAQSCHPCAFESERHKESAEEKQNEKDKGKDKHNEAFTRKYTFWHTTNGKFAQTVVGESFTHMNESRHTCE